MRKQYHFRPAASGAELFDACDVNALIVRSAHLPVEQVEVASIAELDTRYWSGGTGTSRTVRQIVGGSPSGSSPTTWTSVPTSCPTTADPELQSSLSSIIWSHAEESAVERFRAGGCRRSERLTC
jgi:hypothetical protein